MAWGEGPVVAAVCQARQRHIWGAQYHRAQRQRALEQRPKPQRCAGFCSLCHRWRGVCRACVNCRVGGCGRGIWGQSGRCAACVGRVQCALQAKVGAVAQHQLLRIYRHARNPALPPDFQRLWPLPVGGQVALNGKVSAGGLTDFGVDPGACTVPVPLRHRQRHHEHQCQKCRQCHQRPAACAMLGASSRGRGARGHGGRLGRVRHKRKAAGHKNRGCGPC